MFRERGNSGENFRFRGGGKGSFSDRGGFCDPERSFLTLSSLTGDTYPSSKYDRRIMDRRIQVVADYDLVNPAFYHQIALARGGGRFAAKIGDLLQERLPASQNGVPRKVVDIAAGTGIVSSHLQSLGYDVTATDLSQKALDFLHENNQSIPTIRGDMNQRLPFEDASFDGAVTLWANRFVRGTTVAQEAHRILRPNGFFIWPLISLESPAWKKQAGSYQLTQPHDVKPVLERIGFDVEDVRVPLFLLKKLGNLNTAYPNSYLVARKI